MPQQLWQAASSAATLDQFYKYLQRQYCGLWQQYGPDDFFSPVSAQCDRK